MIEGYRTVAFCVSDIQNEDIQSILEPIYKVLSDNGWKLIIFNTCTDLFRDNPFDRGEASIFKLINYDYIDAVIVYSQGLKNDVILADIMKEAQKNQKPVISIDENGFYEGCLNVAFDEHNAFHTLVTHLVEDHKFTDIACIAGFKGNPVSEKRVDIFCDVLKQHNIHFNINDESRFGYGNFYSVPTIEVMDKFMQDGNSLPQAIVCINDSMAIAVCEYLAERNISVPQQVVVTGFDGIQQEKYNFPRLTTCRRDMDLMAEFIVSILQDAFEGRETKSDYIFPYTADFSESCGCKKCLIENVNKSITNIYSKMSDTVQYERSMNNMLTKLTDEANPDKIREIMKYYIKFDSYLCINSDFCSNNHTYEENPFTEKVIGNKFFYGCKTVDEIEFSVSQLIPDMSEFINKKSPAVVFSIHNQQYVYGYMFAYLGDFSYSSRKIQRFAMNLDNCISTYAHQYYLKASNTRLKEIQNEIIISFADIVESRDDFTGQHVKRTSEYFKILVSHLAENPKYSDVLTEDVQELMYKAAALHDIGKIKIADNILNKPGKLTDEEFEIIKSHTFEGEDIIKRTLTNIESDDYVRMACEMALYHHEKWNGYGYPCKLSGDNIPISARIMAVVDVFDALASKRVYKEAFSADKAFGIIEESSGSHFDPDIVSVFLSIRDKIEEVLNENPDSISLSI